MKKIFVIICIFTLTATGILLAKFKSRTPTVNIEPHKPIVATTIFPLYDITRQIAGDRITVIPLMSGDRSAHTFQPNTQTATKLKGAAIIFKIGNGLDDWSNSFKKDLAAHSLILPVSEGINLRVSPDKSIDPHYWLSLPNAMVITKNITKQLIALDPANKDYYQSNEAVYLKKLQAADTEIKEQFKSVSQKKIVMFHDAWYYFAEHYGLKIVATYEENLETEPSPQYLTRFIQSVRKNNIGTIFYEPQFSSLSIRKIATDENLVSDILHPMESGGDTTSDSYIATMKENARKIHQALVTQQ